VNYHFGKEARKIFDLLVYRCDEKKYLAEQAIDCEKYIRGFGFNPSSKEKHITDLRQHWFEKCGGPWTLNKAVGLITLLATPYQIGGLFYLANRRIMKRMAQKRIFFQGKLFGFNIWPTDDSEIIYSHLRQMLKGSVVEHRSLRGLVIDFEPLDTLGSHIDWAAITHKRRDNPKPSSVRMTSDFP
jgi:hypothetical protein